MKTFDQIRLEFMDKNPAPSYNPDLYLSKRFTKSELLEELKEFGIELSERTLNYYVSIGLVNNPYVGPKKRGKGKESYFSRVDAETIRLAKLMQTSGRSLEDIKRGCVITKATFSLHSEPEADHGKIYFYKLAHLLINNLPNPYTEQSIKEYLEVECQPDRHGNRIEFYIANTFIAIETALDDLSKIAFDCDIPHAYKQVNLLFETSLEALYYRLLKPNDLKVKIEIATLNRAEYRIGVLSRYTESQIKTIKFIVDNSSNPDLSKLPSVQKILAPSTI